MLYGHFQGIAAHKTGVVGVQQVAEGGAAALLGEAAVDAVAGDAEGQGADLGLVVAEVAALPLDEQLAVDAEKTLHTDIADGIHVKGDSKCLYELVNILVDNAVKYCDDHGDIQVSLRRPRLGKGAVVAVTNTYADGANVDYSRFFERFYRGDTSHNSQKAGYGIGLSMAEELTKLMDGKINVSYKAQRITFTVRLG